MRRRYRRGQAEAEDLSRPAREPEDGERRLSELVPGEAGRVTGIDGDPDVARRLMELGLVPGTRVEVVRRAPLGDPVEVRVRQIHISIRHSEAKRIRVAQS